MNGGKTVFGRKKRGIDYDRERLEPVIRCSICTGEQVAGFRDRRTGAFREVALIRGEEDLSSFRREYGVEGPIAKIY